MTLLDALFPTRRLIQIIEERTRSMATQADIDRIASEVASNTQVVVEAESNIRADIANIKSQNPDLDLSGLEASVAPLSAAAQSLRTLADENPDVLPPVEPTP